MLPSTIERYCLAQRADTERSTLTNYSFYDHQAPETTPKTEGHE